MTDSTARRALLGSLAAACALTLAGCSSAAPATTTTEAASSRVPAAAAQSAGIIIDVRTPAEFAEGHVEGAVNIDLTAADFTDRIAELDPLARYTVYCRTGNRSATAAEAMAEVGIAEVTDAGSLAEAAALTGLPVVKS